MKYHLRKFFMVTGVAAMLTMTACGTSESAKSTQQPQQNAVEETKQEDTTEAAAEAASDSAEEKSEEKSSDSKASLSLWTDGAQAKKQLTDYMESITDEKSSDFIPVKNRIAVFDLDGTLFCETDPNYFDYTLLVHRVLEDENYKDKASDFEKETAEKIVKQNETGESFEGLEIDHGKCIASSFSGMTMEEFSNYIQEFKKSPMPSYEGMNRGDGWYKPMLEIVDYLKANDFTVYIVSGTDRFIVRSLMENSPLDDIPKSQIMKLF